MRVAKLILVVEPGTGRISKLVPIQYYLLLLVVLNNKIPLILLILPLSILKLRVLILLVPLIPYFSLRLLI